MDGLKNKYSQEQVDRILEIKSAVSDSCVKIEKLILEKAKEMKLSKTETWLFRNRTVSSLFATCFQVGIDIEKNLQNLNTEIMKNETIEKNSTEKKERKTTKNH